MRVNDVEIRIGGLKEFERDALDHRPRSGKVVFIPPAFVSRVLSRRRIELLECLRENQNLSVSRLALKLKRKQEAVSRDLSMLKRFDLVVKGDRVSKKKPEIVIRI